MLRARREAARQEAEAFRAAAEGCNASPLRETDMHIERVKKLSVLELSEADFSLYVETEALPPFSGSALANVTDVPHYQKHYSLDAELLENAKSVESMIAVARVGHHIAGVYRSLACLE